MRILRFALPAIAALTVLAPTAGHADQYKWCAEYSGGRDGIGATNCGFVTLEQCRATISGIGGWCSPNPFYTGPEPRRRQTNGRRYRDER